MVNEKIEKTQGQGMENVDLLPENQLKFNEDGSITIQNITLANPIETLKYLKKQEEIITNKIRESNKSVVNEVKDMLESVHKGGLGPDKIPNYSYVCKRYDVDGPINFLSKYTGSLENFMDSLVDVIKGRKEFCEAIYERVGVSNEMLKNMTNKSFIEMIKKDIEKIPTYNYDESVKTASYYVRAVRLVCIRLGMD